MFYNTNLQKFLNVNFLPIDRNKVNRLKVKLKKYAYSPAALITKISIIAVAKYFYLDSVSFAASFLLTNFR